MKQQNLEALMQEKDGTTHVDWDVFNVMDEYTNNRNIFDTGVDELVKKGVLSLKPIGNYILFGRDSILNPHLYSGTLYFTKRDDAKGYMDAVYKDATYKIYIAKAEVIK